MNYNIHGEWFNQFTGNFRFYAGGNKFKGLLEIQYQNIDDPMTGRVESLFGQIGAEVNLFRGAWIHFSTGLIYALQEDKSSALRSNLNIFLTFPENFNLFR